MAPEGYTKNQQPNNGNYSFKNLPIQLLVQIVQCYIKDKNLFKKVYQYNICILEVYNV